jgi:hypothetical protein
MIDEKSLREVVRILMEVEQELDDVDNPTVVEVRRAAPERGPNRIRLIESNREIDAMSGIVGRACTNLELLLEHLETRYPPRSFPKSVA